MTITRKVLPAPLKRALWVAVLALAPLGVACAWQAVPASRAAQSGLQYRQTAQQQKTRDQLQKSQLQQQLHQGVADNARRPNADNARRPNANDARARKQQDEADRAQRARDYANQQDLLNRQRDAATLPRVIPKDLPAPSRSR